MIWNRSFHVLIGYQLFNSLNRGLSGIWDSGHIAQPSFARSMRKTLDRGRAGRSHGAVLLIITHTYRTHMYYTASAVFAIGIVMGCALKQLVSDLLTLLRCLCSYIYALPFNFMHGCISFDLSQIGFRISHRPSHECTLSHTPRS